MHVVVMGVTGSGKTTVGLRLADQLRVPFADADDFHSPDAVAKMAADVPLTDDDRWPWLERVGEWLADGDDRVVADQPAGPRGSGLVGRIGGAHRHEVD